MLVAERIEARRNDLRPAERRVAEVVLTDPEAVAFGTVAGLAARAGTSGATVVRLAARLGYDGFVALQTGVQDELARRLRPAIERIRQPPAGDVVGQTLAVESDNLHGTLEVVDRAAFTAAVQLIAGVTGRVFVVSGDASHGIADLLASELGMLRPDVTLVAGSELRIARTIAHAGHADAAVAIDIRRYDRWVLDTASRLARLGVKVVAVTDSTLSPLASHATISFVVSAVGVGPFDSQVGTLALANALVSGVAGALQSSATARLDRVEAAWSEAGALVEP